MPSPLRSVHASPGSNAPVCSTPQGRQGYDLLGSTQQMAEKIKTKWTNPEVSVNCCPRYMGAAIIFRKLLPGHGATAVVL